jgi:hypothetical protein
LAYHPQKPWVCFSINLFMSAISAPFWGGPFMFFWHWGVLKWIWQKHTKTHSKCWHHWFGLRDNLQETMVFTIKYRAFL